MNLIIRKTAAFLLSLCIAVSLLLTGCDTEKNEPNFPVPVSNTTRSALELSDDIYMDSDLDMIFKAMPEYGTATALDKEYPIRCLRKDDDGYHVVYEGNKHVLVLRFDREGNWIETERLHSIFRMTDSRGKLDKLQVGDSVKKVQKADPPAYFSFLTSEGRAKIASGEEQLLSDHYTEDGYCTHITYEQSGDDYVIKTIGYELI